MRTSHYILFFFCAILLSISDANAQTDTISYKNKTYIFDYGEKKVYRLDTTNISPKLTSKHFRAEQTTPFNEIYKQTLSAERRNELSGKRSIVKIGCNPTGHVQIVEFLFMDDLYYTIEEIERLETAILNYKFNIVYDSEEAARENGNYYFAMTYRFPRTTGLSLPNCKHPLH